MTPLERLKHLAIGGPRLPVILQSELAECGLACLAMVASFHAYDINLISLRKRYPSSATGSTLRSLSLIANKMGFQSRAVRLEPKRLRQLVLPAILHWRMDHFVVLKAISRSGRAILHDPATGRRTCTLDELGRSFTGIALELFPSSSFERKREGIRLKVSDLWGRSNEARTAFWQLIVLTLIVQVAILAAPLYMQTAVDQTIIQGDRRILLPLGLGFLLITLIRLGADLLRTTVIAGFGAALGFRITAVLFRHLIHLPVDFFEKRHVGDVVSKFGSTRPIKEALSDWAVTAFVDGITALVLLAAMLYFSKALSLVSCTALFCSVILRLATKDSLRHLQQEAVFAEAREQSSFIETLRGLQSIKLFGKEADRETHWLNLAAESTGKTAKSDRFRGVLGSVNNALYSIENIAIIYIGTIQVLNNSLSLGMLFAFVLWKQMFLERTTRLLESAIRWKLLDIHLERISDIALTELETGLTTSTLNTEFDHLPFIPVTIRGGLTLDRVSYVRVEDGRPLLRCVCAQIEAGEFIAITGPSGSGKTTLLKIIMGLLRPSGGGVLVDGIPLERIGPTLFRTQIGAVMQDDHLLSGTIADNITFFDTAPDVILMQECARTAAIAVDIMDMPLNYNTTIGDMGSSLSGGQRQRLLLARALYRRPRILFMDEGTSNLDVEKEQEINTALKRLSVTRVVVAHRRETLAAADRILCLTGGELFQMTEMKRAELQRGSTFGVSG